MFIPPYTTEIQDWMKDMDFAFTPETFPGVIELPDLNSRDAAQVAQTAHEASHARMNAKAKGKLYRNEKLTNQLATTWLKKNLTGVALHVALETILKSKIDYGHN